MWKDIGWPVKGPGAFHMVLLTLFLVVDLIFRLKVIDLEIELKVLVG